MAKANSSRATDNEALVSAGLSPDRKSADGLRKRISDSGQTVQEYILSHAQDTTFGGEAQASGADEMSDVSALMTQEKLSFLEAKMVRDLIIRSGKTVQAYLVQDAMDKMGGVKSDPGGPLVVFRAAGELLGLAGTKEKAIEAIDMFAKLSAPVVLD